MHSFAISLLTACTEKCHWIHLSLSLSLSLSLRRSHSISLSLARSPCFPSIFPFLHLRLLSALLSLCLVCLCLSLSLCLTNLLTFLSFLTSLSVYLDHSPRLSRTVAQRERDWRQDKNTGRRECVLETQRAVQHFGKQNLENGFFVFHCFFCGKSLILCPCVNICDDSSWTWGRIHKFIQSDVLCLADHRIKLLLVVLGGVMCWKYFLFLANNSLMKWLFAAYHKSWRACTELTSCIRRSVL